MLAGDLWGCVGFWYSGRWHDSGAEQYISTVRGLLDQKVWLTADFACTKSLGETCAHDYDCCTEACSTGGTCCRKPGAPAASAAECCSGSINGSQCQ